MIALLNDDKFISKIVPGPLEVTASILGAFLIIFAIIDAQVLLLTGRYTPRQPTLIGKNSNGFSCFPQFLKLLKTPWHDLPIIDMLWKRLATFCFSKRPVQVECVQKIVFSNFISWHRFLLALLLVVEVQLCAL